MPFVVVNVKDGNFASLQSSFSGHSAIKHIGESSAAQAPLRAEADGR
jgi:hypothetical protein